MRSSLVRASLHIHYCSHDLSFSCPLQRCFISVIGIAEAVEYKTAAEPRLYVKDLVPPHLRVPQPTGYGGGSTGYGGGPTGYGGEPTGYGR